MSEEAVEKQLALAELLCELKTLAAQPGLRLTDRALVLEVIEQLGVYQMGPQNLSERVNALPETESLSQLQERLDAVGSLVQLNDVSAARIPDAFREALADVLNTPVGELSVSKIRALTTEAQAAKAEVERQLPAFMRYNLQVTTGPFGVEAYFVQPAGTSIREILSEVSDHYAATSSQRQKEFIPKLNCGKHSAPNPDFDERPEDPSGHTIILLDEGRGKTREEQVDPDSGDILFNPQFKAADTAIVLAAAALYIDKSIHEGTLVMDPVGSGDLLQGRAARTRTGVVGLVFGDLREYCLRDGSLSDEVTVAATYK